MRTVMTIEIGPRPPRGGEGSDSTLSPKGTLFLDVLVDPPALAIRREGGGLVRVEARELRHLVEALRLAAGDLAVLAGGDHD